MITLALEARTQCWKEKIIVFIIPSHMFSIVLLTRQHLASVWYHTLVAHSLVRANIRSCSLSWGDSTTWQTFFIQSQMNSEATQKEVDWVYVPQCSMTCRVGFWRKTLSFELELLGRKQLKSRKWRATKMDVWSLKMTCTWDVYTRLATSHRLSIFLTLVRVENPPRAALTCRCLLGNPWIYPKKILHFLFDVFPRNNNTQPIATEDKAGNSIYV